jgi:UDP-N-acetylmuramoyl-L-alanyl-D-glutamate--2,6-diaminopimelate ligase
MTIRLETLVERLRRERLSPDVVAVDEGWRLLELEAITADSRRVAGGTLFCAVRGTAGDGHGYLRAAAEADAVAAIVEEPQDGLAIPQVRVSDSRLATAYAAAELYRDPWSEITLIGITGTNGKTTTAAILRHLLSRRAPASSIGTLGAVGADGAVIPGTEGLTTPSPVDVAEWLRTLADGGVQGVAMEVSSHALAQRRVDAARFDAAIFTNLSRDHLDYHGTLEAYRDAKLRLLDLLKPGALPVVNIDDAVWRGVAERSDRCVRFGSGARAEIRAEDVTMVPEGTRWKLHTPDGSAVVVSPLCGAHNVSNALAAAGALWSLGWKADELADSLASLPQVPGRLELVPGPPGAPAVLIDYAHTPDALARALAAVRPLTSGRVIVVFGAGGDRDPGKRPDMGRVASMGADLVVVTSDNPRTEDPERIIDDIEAGMGDAPRLRVPNRREAIRRALAEAGPDDLVLLAGKGHETYQIWGAERHSFDEREVVRAYFEEGAVN